MRGLRAHSHAFRWFISVNARVCCTTASRALRKIVDIWLSRIPGAAGTAADGATASFHVLKSETANISESFQAEGAAGMRLLAANRAHTHLEHGTIPSHGKTCGKNPTRTRIVAERQKRSETLVPRKCARSLAV